MRKKEYLYFEQGRAEMLFKWKITDFFSIIQDEKIREYKSEFFDFGHFDCHFELHRSSRLFPGYMNLSLIMGIKCYWGRDDKYSVEYSYGFEAQSGIVEKIVRGIVTDENVKCGKCFFRLSEIEERKSELTPSGVATIICKLKFNTSHLEVPEEPPWKKLRKLDTLSENFKSLFVNKDSCDVTLQGMDKEYKAHSVVLIARSSVFASMFQQETSEKQTGIVTRHRKKKLQKKLISRDRVLTIPDCDSESFEMFLKFLYCGELDSISVENALHLYEISNKYNVKELKIFCMEFLIENLTIENICNIVIIADKYNDSKLLSATENFFNDNASHILETSKWDSLTKSNYFLSKKYLERNSLKMQNPTSSE